MSSSGENYEQRRGTNLLGSIGIAATIVYIFLLAISIYIAASHGWITIQPVTLNEIGDLLAGIFGPLAIFWLVLGFFQQGEELKNSVTTLRMQAHELSLSVEQQRELVNVTRETLEHEREALNAERQERARAARGDFLVNLKPTMRTGDGQIMYAFTVNNVGASVRDASVEAKGGIDRTLDVVQFWPANDERIVMKDADFRPPINDPVVVSIFYRDGTGAQNWAGVLLLPPSSQDIGQPFYSLSSESFASREAFEETVKRHLARIEPDAD